MPTWPPQGQASFEYPVPCCACCRAPIGKISGIKTRLATINFVASWASSTWAPVAPYGGSAPWRTASAELTFSGSQIAYEASMTTTIDPPGYCLLNISSIQLVAINPNGTEAESCGNPWPPYPGSERTPIPNTNNNAPGEFMYVPSRIYHGNPPDYATQPTGPGTSTESGTLEIHWEMSVLAKAFHAVLSGKTLAYKFQVVHQDVGATINAMVATGEGSSGSWIFVPITTSLVESDEPADALGFLNVGDILSRPGSGGNILVGGWDSGPSVPCIRPATANIQLQALSAKALFECLLIDRTYSLYTLGQSREYLPAVGAWSPSSHMISYLSFIAQAASEESDYILNPPYLPIMDPSNGLFLGGTIEALNKREFAVTAVNIYDIS